MKKISEPVTFFGSGPVAAESLRLIAQDFTIEAVITKPRPTHHKGPVPVLDLAAELDLQTYTAADKAELDALIATRPLKSRLALLIDFGIIVSQNVIDYFELGIINSHFSLLPEWRGADPITFSILSGQPKTGISLMLLTAGMDEGPLLAQTDYNIEPDETTPSLTAALIDLSYQSLQTIVPLYVSGDVSAAPQEQVTLADSPEPTYSRKLTKQDGRLDPTKPAAVLEREVRAFQDWPKSKLRIGELDVAVIKAHVSDKVGPVGSLSKDNNALTLHCGESSLVIDVLKPAGKQAMTAAEFMRGYGTRV